MKIKNISDFKKGIIFLLGRVLYGSKKKDEIYLKILYKTLMNRKLDLDCPKTFNEKLQWLKINNKKPIYTTMVDKYEAKNYVSSLIGDEYIIPTFGVWNSFSEIDFSKLPEKFVLKCTHDSGGLVIVENKANLDYKKAEKKISHCLKRNYYINTREWPYKNVKPRIIAEKYLEEMDSVCDDVLDFKVHCFNGIPKFILVCSSRFKESGLKEDFFDLDWNHIAVQRAKHHNATTVIEKPKSLNKMLEISKKLSENEPFLRVDFYEINNKLFFGELTFFPSSGLTGFDPEKYDKIFGDMLALPNYNC